MSEENAKNDGDDDGWLEAEEEGNLEIPSRPNYLYSDKEDEEVDDLAMDNPSTVDASGEVEEEGEKSDTEDIDVESEPNRPEKVSEEAVKLVKSCVNLKISSKENNPMAPAKSSAPELQFALVCCCLEQGLRLVDRLLADIDPSAVTSPLCAPIWRALLKVLKKKKTVRQVKFATLLLEGEEDEEKDVALRSLLLGPTQSVREWVARVTNRLLRREAANVVVGSNEDKEKRAPAKRFVSPFFTGCKNIPQRVCYFPINNLNEFYSFCSLFDLFLLVDGDFKGFSAST